MSNTFKIGVHVNNPALFLLSHLELAQEALAPFGADVEFHHYTGGTQTGLKLVDGTIDVGGTGATPPISDQAAGLDVVYVAHSDPRPAHGTLLVTPGRDVRDVGGPARAARRAGHRVVADAAARGRAGPRGRGVRGGRGGGVRAVVAGGAAGGRAGRVDRAGAGARPGGRVGRGGRAGPGFAT